MQLPAPCPPAFHRKYTGRRVREAYTLTGRLMGLRFSYTCLAPFYDRIITQATRKARHQSLQHLPQQPARILLAGMGTGLDAPFLPLQHQYVGLDLTPAMLHRAMPRIRHLDFLALQGNVHCLPFANASFDHTVLHLILAVVPDPVRCLQEAMRVTRPGGQILILDKFLRPGQKAPIRRLLTPLAGQIASRLDVVLEEVLAQTPGLILRDDQAALARGWFRRIRLERTLADAMPPPPPPHPPAGVP